MNLPEKIKDNWKMSHRVLFALKRIFLDYNYNVVTSYVYRVLIGVYRMDNIDVQFAEEILYLEI